MVDWSFHYWAGELINEFEWWDIWLVDESDDWLVGKSMAGQLPLCSLRLHHGYHSNSHTHGLWSVEAVSDKPWQVSSYRTLVCCRRYSSGSESRCCCLLMQWMVQAMLCVNAHCWLQICEYPRVGSKSPTTQVLHHPGCIVTPAHLHRRHLH